MGLDAIDARIGFATKSAREAKGLTQTELGLRLERVLGAPVPQTTISRWEKGAVALEVATVLAIEVALQLSPGTLLVSSGIIPADLRPADVETSLRSDQAIDAELREDLVRVYRSYRAVSARVTQEDLEARIRDDAGLTAEDAASLAVLYRNARRRAS